MIGIKITPELIIENLIDELAMGELGQSVDGVHFLRLAPGILRLEYGELGSFILSVDQAGSDLP